MVEYGGACSGQSTPYKFETQNQAKKQIASTRSGKEAMKVVVQMMIDCKKPMVGHNMINDLAYIYSSFID